MGLKMSGRKTVAPLLKDAASDKGEKNGTGVGKNWHMRRIQNIRILCKRRIC